MNASILETIKSLLLLTEDDTSFNQQLIVYINSVMMTLNQLGVGPDKPFIVTSPDNTWQEFIGDYDGDFLQAVKIYIYMKTKILFDAPSTSFVLDAMQNQISDYEWRLQIQAEERRRDHALQDSGE